MVETDPSAPCPTCVIGKAANDLSAFAYRIGFNSSYDDAKECERIAIRIRVILMGMREESDGQN